MRRKYEEPEFDLFAFSFESILGDDPNEEPIMGGSEPEGQNAGTGWD